MKSLTFYKMLFLFLLFASCRSTKNFRQHYTFEDKQVFELVDRLNANPDDKEAKDFLPEAYGQALEKRRTIKDSAILNLTGGDRHMALATSWQVIQNMYNAITASAAAHKVIPNPINATDQIQRERYAAAEAFYNEGLIFLNYNTRQHARNALDAFTKANQAVPGFRDVAQLTAIARERSIISVVVNPVNYFGSSFTFWGFNNDFLQDQMVRDLNFRSGDNVRFYTRWQASARGINADKVIDLNFTNITVGPVLTRNNSFRRTAQIQTGSTHSVPAQPVFTTVTATVFVTERFMQSRATLQSRIFNTSDNSNIMFDNFPASHNWSFATARFTGDRRALQPQDWALINNTGRMMNVPGRNFVAEQLMRDAYSRLINRIVMNSRFFE